MNTTAMGKDVIDGNVFFSIGNKLRNIMAYRIHQIDYATFYHRCISIAVTAFDAENKQIGVSGVTGIFSISGPSPGPLPFA